jgi:branched-chain amino acid transport system permease protein
VRGRPELFTSYQRDQAPLNTPGKRAGLGLLLVALLVFPFSVTAELTARGATALLSAVGAIGLNLVTGYAGQISLGQAFFIGLGAYTAAVLSGDPDTAAPSATASTWPSGCPPPGSSRPWSGC